MSILEANIENIRRYNPVLADKLINHNINNDIKFELIKSESDDINLVYNNILLHDAYDPQKEAITVFNKLEDISEYSISVVIGLGLGYLFKRVYLSSKSKIIVFEPDINILRFTLEVVDFSEEFEDKRVYIANSRQELIKFLDEVYLHKDSINVCGLASCQTLYPEVVINLIDDLPKIKLHLQSNYLCIFEKSFDWAKEGMKNIPLLSQNSNIDALRGKFKSRPALIVSSGPSLDKSIETIVKYRDNSVIFATGNSYKALLQYDIQPDFLGFIEVNDNISQVKDLDISGTNLIIQAIANNNVLKLNGKRKFIFYSNNDLFSRWLAQNTQFSTKDYENKGTVSYCLLNAAHLMGCNPIILVGQDLAYTDGKCYSADSSYGSLICVKDEETGKYTVEINNLNEFIKYYAGYLDLDTANLIINTKLSMINNNMTYVLGQSGEMLPSEPNYASFIKFFEEFAYDNSMSDLKLINSSIGGALIKGYKSMTLEDAMKELKPLDINVESIISEILDTYEDPVKKNINIVIDNLKSMIESIDKFIPHAKDGFVKSGQLIDELGRKKPDVNKIRKLANALMNYYVESKEKLFNPYQILVNCVFRDLLELSKIFEDENNINGIDDIFRIAQASQIFYQEFLYKVIEFKKIAEQTLEKLTSTAKDY